ncbi:hypothetical protein [Methanosphaera sp. WGK6]|nr:hypothetical protein [Methanosphaera sp. WGK6]
MDDINIYWYVAAIIVGFLLLIYPPLVAYIIGLFMIAYGVLQIIK